MKRYILSFLATIAIVVISTIPVPEVKPLENIPLFDKWVHFLMYGGLCCVYWFDFYRNGYKPQNCAKWILWIVIFPIAFGGAMELCQAYLTTCRNGDWIDFVANSIGVALAIPLGLTLVKGIAKKFMKI